MGKPSVRKGYRAEREFAQKIQGERVPLSGALDGGGDVLGLGLRWEVKIRADGFQQLYKWLAGRDALAVRADRSPWLIVIPLEKFLELINDG